MCPFLNCKIFRAFWFVLACIRSILKSPASSTVGIVVSSILSGKDEEEHELIVTFVFE